MDNSHLEFHPLIETRYDRHHLIPWWDQQKLAEAHAIVAGAGALGNEVLKLLALLGFGQVLVVDFDVISPSNLARTVLFRPEDVGRPKVEVAVERLLQINPELRMRGLQGDLRFDLGLGEYRRADLVFGCLDSVNARWALNRKCRLAGVTWINGGISDFHGQVTRYDPSAGACYECTFTETTYERFNRRYSCPYGFLNPQAEDSVPTTAVTTSLIAALQVQEALYFLHGLPDGLQPGERLNLYLKPYSLSRDRLPLNPDCLAHETLPADIPVWYDGSPSCTADQAIRVAQDRYGGRLALELAYDLVHFLECDTCGKRQEILLPKEKVYQQQAMCPRCGQLRTPTLVNQVVAESALAGCSLRAVNIPPHEILAFRDLETGDVKYLELED